MKTRSFALIVILVIQAACNAANFGVLLHAGLAAGAPILDRLQAQGKITAKFRTDVLGDIAEEATDVSTMVVCFNAVPKGDAQSKLKHLRCVETLNGQTSVILARGHFGALPEVKIIADDIKSIIDAAIIFYGGTPTPSAMGTGAITSQDATERAIKHRIEQLKRDLGQ